MRGRKPTPDNVLRLRGTLRADRHGSRMRTECAEPDAPGVLRGAALDVWRRTVPLLLELRAVAKIDGDALARYCVAQAAWEALVVRAGRTKKHKDLDALMKVMRGLSSTANRLGGELGLTPASRSRVRASAPDTDHEPSEKARYFAG
jgi:P27 family predicted phage terminase small subunit